MDEIIASQSIDAANQTYGELREGVHIAGYSIERAMQKLEALICGDAWRAVGGGFDDINRFMDSIRLDSFRPAAEQRKRIGARIKELQPAASNRTIAKVLGVNPSTIDEDMIAGNPAREEKKASVHKSDEWLDAGNPAPTLDGASAARLVRRREERKARDAEAAADRPKIGGDGSFECRHGDFRAVLADLRDVDAIITDPPYHREYLPLLRDMAALADCILKPDGIMAVLYGNTYLPEAYAQMTGFRPYRWTACYLTEGNSYVSFARKVQSNWKPILIYGGGDHRFGDLFRATGDGPGKEHHEWGQNLEAFQAIIAALTIPGAVIVDPFAGGGTTLIAAKSIGRHAIGAEINGECMVFKLDAA